MIYILGYYVLYKKVNSGCEIIEYYVPKLNDDM